MTDAAIFAAYLFMAALNVANVLTIIHFVKEAA